MPKIYKIHPAIGIARVGDHPDRFFIGPEVTGRPPIEIDASDAEKPLASYKQKVGQTGHIKRQAARFRVFEYDTQADGTLKLLRELTPDQPDHPTIEWSVDLVNSKAAGDRILDGAGPRNPEIAPKELIIRNSAPHTIAGIKQSGKLFDQGRFRGTVVYLGELQTDKNGRLLVLGGRGISDSVPAGVDIEDFANNPFWYDDVADGPVTATVKFAGQPDRQVAVPAWVIVAPPDFAPGVGGIVTLYDVAFQAALQNPAFGLTAPAVPSFRHDILPVLERSSNLRWVHKWGVWNPMSRDWALLSKANDPASAPERVKWFNKLMTPGLSNFEMPPFLRTLLQAWRDGRFIDDQDAPVVAPTLTPQSLDRAALDACTGANFFPGIEASLNTKDPTLYMEPFRLSHQKVKAGDMTQIMAVPWQADFLKCSGNWWPSQRPDFVYATPPPLNGMPRLGWDDGADGDHEEMVKTFGRLGFVVAKTVRGKTVHLEVDRDLPRA